VQAASRNVAQFRRDFALLRAWQADLEALTAGQGVGCLHVSLSNLQAQLAGTLDKVVLGGGGDDGGGGGGHKRGWAQTMGDSSCLSVTAGCVSG
jgi:hypothetical protein